MAKLTEVVRAIARQLQPEQGEQVIQNLEFVEIGYEPKPGEIVLKWPDG